MRSTGPRRTHDLERPRRGVRRARAAGFVVALAAAVPTVAGCTSGFVVDGARAHARVVHQVEAGPRIPGTPGHAAIRDWIRPNASASAAVSRCRASSIHRRGDHSRSTTSSRTGARRRSAPRAVRALGHAPVVRPRPRLDQARPTVAGRQRRRIRRRRAARGRGAAAGHRAARRRRPGVLRRRGSGRGVASARTTVSARAGTRRA